MHSVLFDNRSPVGQRAFGKEIPKVLGILLRILHTPKKFETSLEFSEKSCFCLQKISAFSGEEF